MIEGAYSGLRVLDLGQGIAAPYCAMILAMHGAEVVKLEPPGGDWSRGLGKAYGDHTAMSAHFNRGKKGIAVDLRAPAGRDVALALAKRADIVIEGFRSGVAARLGIGYEAVRALNPRVIYVSVSGFGQEGPWAGRSGRVFFRPAHRPASGCVANVSATCMWVPDHWQFRSQHRRRSLLPTEGQWATRARRSPARWTPACADSSAECRTGHLRQAAAAQDTALSRSDLADLDTAGDWGDRLLYRFRPVIRRAEGGAGGRLGQEFSRNRRNSQMKPLP
jgi:hypothetical protein